MARWQRLARIAVGALGIAFAIVVYAAIGERRTATSVERPARLDPRAILESAGAAFQQFKNERQNYSIEAERQLMYEDGSTTFFGVAITIRNRDGRDLVVSGREARSRANDSVREIAGDVKLTTSDGFTLTADRATFDEAAATLHVPGAVVFGKGRMTGAGAGMSYNQTTDVLTLERDVRVHVSADAKAPGTEFSSAAATLSRREQFLSLEGNVRTVRGAEVLEGERSVARLSENAEHVTYIELRGNARVTGGTAVESMTARAIDLDYADDGEALERVVLVGDGRIAMPGGEDGPGRRFSGDSLDLTFAPAAVLTQVIGRGNVQLDLPVSQGEPARSVKAQSVDATGEPATGLTGAYFRENVEFREDSPARGTARTARSDTLQIALGGDALTSAVFAGRVQFGDDGLQASAAKAAYDPAAGTLHLSGADGGGGPRVGDAQIQIEAESIAVVLDGALMTASGNVKTTLQARGMPARSGGAAGQGTPGAGRMPGLLSDGSAVNVNAGSLDYGGSAGHAVYSGNALLWQGETAIRADVITLDRTRGDLAATGNARSNIVLDTGASVGRASEIRYHEAARTIAYVSPPSSASRGAPAPQVGTPADGGSNAVAGGSQAAPGQTETGPGREGAPDAGRAAGGGAGATGPGARGGSAPVAVQPQAAQLSGPQGELRAARIELFLAPAASRAERLEAYTDVTIRLDRRVATGDQLSYDAEKEQYVITGRATVPVTIVEECRTTTGRTVTFFKSSDRIIVDGNEEVRTESSRGGPCPQTAAP